MFIVVRLDGLRKTLYNEGASKILDVSVRRLQIWDKEGKIRCVRTVGGRRRIPESEIKRILGLWEEGVVVGYACL